MPLVKKLARSLWASVIENFTIFLKIAIKSLFYGPAFYGINWLSSHHAPSHAMWYAFFLGAYFFSNTPKKAKIGPNAEESPQSSSSIILPVSSIPSANRPR